MVLDTQQVKNKAHDLGFHKVGVARADALGKDIANLQRWLSLGYAADMAWMHDPRRQDIQQVLPGVRSVVVVALHYNTPQSEPAPGTARISRYAQGRDYHKVMGKPLQKLARWLDAQQPGNRSLAYVDTGPIQEKAWAQAAGLGWIGKNACLITLEYGSWVFLGEVLTTVELEVDIPHPNHCGTCTRCLKSCPTAAIVEPAYVDARLCLAYHTIENRAETLPHTIARGQNNWVVGCDVCQSCCPFNQRSERWQKFTDIADLTPRPFWQNPQLTKLASLDDATFDLWTRGSAIRRVRAQGLRRNSTTALTSLREQNWAE